MSGKNVLSDLVTLVKVFDVNYVTDNDCEKLRGLDVNQERGVSEAVQRLLAPEFHGFTHSVKARLLSSLQESLADPQEDFCRLFDRVELAFDSPIESRRFFMQSLLRALESQ